MPRQSRQHDAILRSSQYDPLASVCASDMEPDADVTAPEQEMFHATTCFFYELWMDFQRQPVSKDQSVIDSLMKDSGLPPNWEPW